MSGYDGGEDWADRHDAELKVAALEAERATLVAQIDVCLNDEEPWDPEDLVQLLEDVRAALVSGETA